MQIVRRFFFFMLVFLPCVLGAQGITPHSLHPHMECLDKYPKDVRALREVTAYYLSQADYDKAILYGERLLKVGYDTDDYKDAVVYAHAYLGQAYTMKGNALNAFNNLGQARTLGESHKNDSVLCSIYNGLGIYAINMQKDYYRAATAFFKGIEVAKRCRHDYLHCVLLANLAETYYLQNDVTGLSPALESYELSHELRNPYLIFCSSFTVAHFYFLRKDYDRAIRYLNESEGIMRLNHFCEQAKVYNLFGRIMHAQGKDEEAMDYFRQSLDLKGEYQMASVIDAYLGYAEILMEQKQYSKAIDLLKTGIDISETRANVVSRGELLKALAHCYEDNNNSAEALKWYKCYQYENDSLYDADKERIISEFKVRYNVGRQEYKLMQQELELLDGERKVYLLISVLMCVFAAAVSIYYLYYRKNKLYRAIVRQNQESIHREQMLQDRISDLQAELANRAASHPQTEKRTASSLTDERKQQLFLRLETLLKDEKMYCDNRLTRDKLAEMLGTNRTYLSQLINEQTNQTFTQYINSIRTKEAVRLLSAPENQTPLKAIASELGFKSMTTFYNLFQATTGMTPSQYRHKVQGMQGGK